jgi:hypothetical protein
MVLSYSFRSLLAKQIRDERSHPVPGAVVNLVARTFSPFGFSFGTWGVAPGWFEGAPLALSQCSNVGLSFVECVGSSEFNCEGRGFISGD